LLQIEHAKFVSGLEETFKFYYVQVSVDRWAKLSKSMEISAGYVIAITVKKFTSGETQGRNGHWPYWIISGFWPWEIFCKLKGPAVFLMLTQRVIDSLKTPNLLAGKGLNNSCVILNYL